MADSKPFEPAKVEEVLETRSSRDRKVDFADKDAKRIANSPSDVPGAGGIEITKHKKVKLSNGLIIENF